MNQPINNVRLIVSGLILFTAGIGMKKIMNSGYNESVSSTVCHLATKYTVQGVDLHCLETIFDEIGAMPQKEIIGQWLRDRHRIVFTNTTCDYIETHMAWCIRYVSQTLPNGIWCELHRRNSENQYLQLIGRKIIFTSNNLGGFKIIRLTDTHIRCLVIFNIQDLDEINMTITENNTIGSYICITYDIVYIDDWSDITEGDGYGKTNNAYIILIDCSFGNKIDDQLI